MEGLCISREDCLTRNACCAQRDYMDSRTATGGLVEELIRSHRAYTESKGAAEGGMSSQRGAGQGVEAGSFVDLLVNGKDKATGAPFSDNVLAQQVM